MFSRLILIAVSALALSHHASAFSMQSISVREKRSTALQAMAGRRAFVGAVVASTIMSSPVFAEEGAVGDLSMPTADQQKDEVGTNGSLFVCCWIIP